MDPRVRRQVKFRRGNKQHSAKKRKTNTKGRQKYSIYKSNRRNAEDAETKKRKKFGVGTQNVDDKKDQSKRQKFEKSSKNETKESSESDAEENHMEQLRATFNSIENATAVESSDESISELSDEDQLEPPLPRYDDDIANDDNEDEEDVDNTSETMEENNDVHSNSPSSKYADSKSENEEMLNSEDDHEEDEIDAEMQNEGEDSTNSKDPFAKHLFYEISDSLLNSLQQVPVIANTNLENWPRLGKLIMQIPHCEESEAVETAEHSIAEKKTYAPLGKVCERINVHKDCLGGINVKSQICGNVVKANKCLTDGEKRLPIPLTSLQSEMFSVINNYQDFYYPERTFENAEEIRFVYCLHIVNHILKTRTKVLHHNARLSKKEDVPEEFRDQGLTRPKVLVLVPFKDCAYKIIKMLIDILIAEDTGNVINRNRFVEDYTGNELPLPKKNPKPEDYELMFRGNVSDDFKIGLTVTKKSLKLYADFYSSDIIIASSLGLRYTIGAEGEPNRDYDFLASIEVLVFDQIEVFMMQNWDHVLHIMNHLHLQPKESHGTDFSRVRTWSLSGWAKYYRQTLIFSSVVLPEINSVFNKKCLNYAGKVKVMNPLQYGSIRQVYVQLPHVFQKFNADSVEDASEARFNFFLGKILPQQRDTLMRQTLIYVASYFDFVRLRNYFKREDIGFVQICEYSKEAKVARARDMFFHGDAHFLLYTERYNFYNRIRIKGIRHVVFYQLPHFPHFYYEICNLMQEANMNKKIGSMSNMTVTVLYSKYDVHQLATIVSSERAVKMLQSDRNVHMLVTDGE